MGGVVLEPGDRIGPYVYQRPLATGGMAIVLLARDPGGEPVALKVLKSHRLGTGLGRFRREFRALSRMAHENVIRVDAYGDIHGHPYIAMELVEGSDLHMEIRALRDLPPLERWAKVERLLIDLLRALAHIHGWCTAT
jgi:serine/threonine-protein kinase